MRTCFAIGLVFVLGAACGGATEPPPASGAEEPVDEPAEAQPEVDPSPEPARRAPRCHPSCCSAEVSELQRRTAAETGDRTIEHECCFCEE